MTYDPHRDAQDERPAAYQPERTAMNICLLLAAIAAFFAIATVWHTVTNSSSVATGDRSIVQRPATDGGPVTERRPR